MVVEYKPDLAGFMTTNAAGAQGQGIDMAVAIGAGTVDKIGRASCRERV